MKKIVIKNGDKEMEATYRNIKTISGIIDKVLEKQENKKTSIGFITEE